MNYLDLPVYRHKDLILAALEKNQALVVESPTGSGKTTQLPVILYEAGYAKNGLIGVTQPRRIAAVSVSEFIARQLSSPAEPSSPLEPSSPAEPLGAAAGERGCPVGYKMRFEDRTNPDTKIKIMTDGILLQEMKLDPWLSKYGLLVVDEAHERSLNIDFILGSLKHMLETRKDFRVIIYSATITARVFSEYFGECPVVKIDAITYPVTLIYDPIPAATGSENAELIINKVNSIVERFVGEKRGGDVLVFLSGEKMIKDCMNALVYGEAGKYLHIVPLYGRLGKEEQERVFLDTPKNKTKVVISTNIAETSVTIDGITCVIDSGLSKLNWYNPRSFTSSLVEAPISRASANQRKGRAGRTREGTCYRLYTRKDFENRPLFTTEEIFRTDLSEVVLRMADLGLTNFEEFDFISAPGREGIVAAIETLKLLDALEADRTLSVTGKMMTMFPLAPRQSRIIVEAVLQCPDVLQETIIAAAFLSTQSPYILPPGEETDARRAHHSFRDPGGDFVSYLKLYNSYAAAANKQKFCEKNYLDERAMAEIFNVVDQLSEILSAQQIPILSGGKTDDYLYCVAKGMIQFVCTRDGRETYRSLTADRICIHPGSVMFKTDPQYIVAGEIVRTSRMYAMSVSPLTREILDRLGGEFREKGGRGKEKPKKSRDFTNNIKIGSAVFEIQTVKGKKEVQLPWEKLAVVKEKDEIPAEVVYKGLRGRITLNGKYELLAGEKLELILSLAPRLKMDGVLERTWPKKKNFSSAIPQDLDAMLAEMGNILVPAIWKNGSKELGFITLFTDEGGMYWFRCSRGFHTSLNESLASLEALIDELGDDVDPGKKHIVNQAYRRLSDFLG